MMTHSDPRQAVAHAVTEYQATADTGALFATLDLIAASAMPDALIEAAEPFRTIPEVAGPLYDRIVAEQPNNARALVILANAYWLGGRGGEAVGELAQRAIAADPANRGGWHMWALSEADPRDRTMRWKQVVERFPDDELAMANLADNAAALAGAEKDYDALDLAVYTYEALLARATMPEQREALDTALRSLRGWQF
jgi:predicted Zn-dependent protease